jgi:hypothetical protein
MRIRNKYSSFVFIICSVLVRSAVQIETGVRNVYKCISDMQKRYISIVSKDWTRRICTLYCTPAYTQIVHVK